MLRMLCWMLSDSDMSSLISSTRTQLLGSKTSGGNSCFSSGRFSSIISSNSFFLKMSGDFCRIWIQPNQFSQSFFWTHTPYAFLQNWVPGRQVLQRALQVWEQRKPGWSAETPWSPDRELANHPAFSRLAARVAKSPTCSLAISGCSACKSWLWPPKAVSPSSGDQVYDMTNTVCLICTCAFAFKFQSSETQICFEEFRRIPKEPTDPESFCSPSGSLGHLTGTQNANLLCDANVGEACPNCVKILHHLSHWWDIGNAFRATTFFGIPMGPKTQSCPGEKNGSAVGLAFCGLCQDHITQIGKAFASCLSLGKLEVVK